MTRIIQSHSFRRIGRILAVLLLISMLFGLTEACRAEGINLNASGTPNRNSAVDLTRGSEGYSTVLYDNTNGLPTSEANAIAETSEGFIWIGSYSGLIRYDGNDFVRMDSTTGITNAICLYVDHLDRLWIGTNDSGVVMMRNGRVKTWGKADGLKANNIRAITEDENGIIYVATTAGVAAIDQNLRVHPIRDERIQEAYMRDLRAGSDGLLYGLTQMGDLFTLKNSRLVNYISHENSGVKDVISLLPDPDHIGMVYLGTEDSRVLYGAIGETFAQTGARDASPLTSIERFESIDGQIWVCAGNGIGIITKMGFTLLDNVPMDSSVGHVMTDYAGNLWFTSTRQGVMKIVPNQFSDTFDRFDLSSAVVNSTCMLDDQLFVGADTGLIVIGRNAVAKALPLESTVTASGEELPYTDLLEMLDGCRIRSIIRDSGGRLWISTWRKYGLLRYDHGKLTVFSEQDGLLSDRIRAVCERKDGSVLVASTGGVSVIEGDSVTRSYGKDDGIVNIEVLTVTEGENGDIVLGTDGGGIYIINDAGTQHVGTEDGLKSDVVMRIKHDPYRNLFWIVTSNSIAYMTADYQVTSIQKFPYSNNFDIYENSARDIWVLSSNGIYVVPADELIANEELTPVYYGRANGLPCIATANSYSELTADGDLYMASTTGVAKVNIETPFEDVNELKVAVPYVDVDGVRIYPDEDGNFTIPSTSQKLTISSFVFNYSLMDPQVSYHLEGFEEENAAISRSDLVPVDYTNLKGGTYNFIMRLKDSMGRGSKEVSVQIVKEKAYYEEVWFIVMVALLVLILLGLSIRYYVKAKTRALEKKQKETMMLVSEITEAFAKVIDMKDTYTNGHSSRVAKYTVMLARELGYDDESVERFYRIALLHDIGKVGIPPEVLNKPGKLSDEEFETIKSHATKGYDTLKDISIMPELAVGAQAHHERPDGKGYPNHLKGDQIPRVAQIIAVADCFDAMYSNRPYRNRMNFDKVVSIIRENGGTQLTQDVVDAFLRLVEKGEFRAPDDFGGGTTENIDNIHKKQDEEEKKHEAEKKEKAEKQAEAEKQKGSEKQNEAEKPSEPPKPAEASKPAEPPKES